MIVGAPITFLEIVNTLTDVFLYNIIIHFFPKES